MKITQIMLAQGFGGAERLFVDLCVSLSGSGQDVQAVCSVGSKAAQILAQHAAVKLQLINILGVWDPFAAGKIITVLKQHKSQVVQAHLARGALLAGKACKKLALPLVVTTHNYINTKYYKYVTVLVPPTRDQYAYYLSKGMNAEHMKIINHFTPIKPAANVVQGNQDILRIVTMGRLVRKKGFHVLLEAFCKLEKTPGLQTELCIGGTGPEQQALSGQISSLRLQNKVRMIGWVDDVKSFLEGGDLFVLPSLDEPFGIVVIEAMATGIPIVSTASSGPGEILDSDTAWLCKVGDVEALTKALQEACENQQDRKRKSENALQRFRAQYSEEAVIPEFIGLYTSLLPAKKKPSRQ